jgi:flagellar biogenesis protein FliO
MMLFFIQAAQASEEYISPELRSSLKQNAYEPNFFGVAFSLFVVICLIYLTGIIYQRLIKVNPKYLKGTNDATLDETELNIISSKSLGQHKGLHVVEVNNSILVLGSTPHNITLLKEFEKKNEGGQKWLK